MFTEEFLDSLEPKKNKYDIREKTRLGFSITVFPSGTKSFTYFYHFNGRKRRMTLGRYPYMSIKQAKKLHKASLILLEAGIDPALRKQLRIIDTHKRLYLEKNKETNNE
jgi:Arm DNA-binding domain